MTFLTICTSTKAQVVEEGNILIDVYYGFPNLFTTVFSKAYEQSTIYEQIDFKSGGAGPFGLRGEYLITDKFGVGLDAGFESSFVSYVESRTEYNSTTMQDETNYYTYDFNTRKIGVMATFNFHVVDNDNIDVAIVLGAGYKNRTFEFTSNEPGYVGSKTGSLIPVAFKIGAVGRYFFTDNIGINFGLGLGQGGLLNGGLSIKL